jgi:hypothetical protein
MDRVLEPVVSEVEGALLEILKGRKLCELVNKIADKTKAKGKAQAGM